MAGFDDYYDKAFQKHCCDLTSFKEEFGHCKFLADMQAIHHWDTGVAR